MLDYTLVTPKATYRMLTPRDLSSFIAMVQACYHEDQGDRCITREQILGTVEELSRHKEKGSLFVFERDEALVGYCILTYTWSNEYSGTVMTIDELYVAPSNRGQGIASDFIALLGKVAPQGCAAIQLEVNRTNRKAAKLYRKLGFRELERSIMVRTMGAE
jgi:ribosomal protein S18 acetylase RimI-like enzyme